ncbi:MAG TPA: hypothetical protein VJ957_03205 [Longimicrobiales bacterium]|nr:hypothetical protein [Longimicrobiales bacterium]
MVVMTMMLTALTLAAPDTGLARSPEPAASGVPAAQPTQAAAPATPAPPLASVQADPAALPTPRFQTWRPPTLPARPGTPRLPMTLAMPGRTPPGSDSPAGPRASAGSNDGRRSTVDGPPAPPDTQQARPPLIDYSDAYYTRLTIHKWASWAMLPLFGLEYYTGTQAYKLGRAAPRWEREVHGPVAATLAGLFALNTVTGVWNLWDGRKDPDGRKWRTTHGLLMLLADAGFVATGLTAPHFEAESGVYGPGSALNGGYGSGNERLHKQIAISSMAVAVVSWVMMLPPFRRD